MAFLKFGNRISHAGSLNLGRLGFKVNITQASQGGNPFGQKSVYLLGTQVFVSNKLIVCNNQFSQSVFIICHNPNASQEQEVCKK